jgi:hypothetical protein
MPLQKFLLVDTQVLHELLMFDLLPTLVVTLHLVLQLLHTVALVSILLQFLPPKVVTVQQLLLEQPHRFIIIFYTL